MVDSGASELCMICHSKSTMIRPLFKVYPHRLSESQSPCYVHKKCARSRPELNYHFEPNSKDVLKWIKGRENEEEARLERIRVDKEIREKKRRERTKLETQIAKEINQGKFSVESVEQIFLHTSYRPNSKSWGSFIEAEMGKFIKNKRLNKRKKMFKNLSDFAEKIQQSTHANLGFTKKVVQIVEECHESLEKKIFKTEKQEVLLTIEKYLSESEKIQSLDELNIFLEGLEDLKDVINLNPYISSKDRKELLSYISAINSEEMRELTLQREKYSLLFDGETQYAEAVIDKCMNKSDAIRLYKSKIHTYAEDTEPISSGEIPFVGVVQEIEVATLKGKISVQEAEVLFSLREWEEGVHAGIADNECIKAVEFFYDSRFRGHEELFSQVCSGKYDLKWARWLLDERGFGGNLKAVGKVLAGLDVDEVAEFHSIESSSDAKMPIKQPQPKKKKSRSRFDGNHSDSDMTSNNEKQPDLDVGARKTKHRNLFIDDD